MISTKYIGAICALVAVALVPTVIHSYVNDLEDDGRRTESIASELAGYRGVAGSRSVTWGARRFDSSDWFERIYVSDGNEVRLTVVRSHDLKSLYHHPELAITNLSFVGFEVQRFSERPEMPVFVLKPGPGVLGSAQYVLHYGDTFVESPIRFQVRTAGELLFRKRQAMTLFFAVEPNASTRSTPEGSSLRVLLAAIDSFLEVPPGP